MYWIGYQMNVRVTFIVVVCYFCYDSLHTSSDSLMTLCVIGLECTVMLTSMATLCLWSLRLSQVQRSKRSVQDHVDLLSLHFQLLRKSLRHEVYIDGAVITFFVIVPLMIVVGPRSLKHNLFALWWRANHSNKWKNNLTTCLFKNEWRRYIGLGLHEASRVEAVLLNFA